MEDTAAPEGALDLDAVREDAADPGAPWRPSRALVVALVVVALLLVGGGLLDARLRARETTALAACATRLAEVEADADRRLGATADYLRPAIDAATGALQAELEGLMSRPAAQAVPGARAVARRCSGIRVAAWHRGLAARQRTLVRRADDRLARLEAVAADGSRYFRP